MTEISHVLDSTEIELLVHSQKHGRYFEDIDLANDIAKKLFRINLTDLSAVNDVKFVKHYEGNRLSGIIIFKMSAWDTAHFGFPIAIIDFIIITSNEQLERSKVCELMLQELKNWLITNSIRFVSCRIPSMDLAVINSLENNGFNFIESWVYSKYNLKENKFSSAPQKLRFATQEDKNVMKEFAKGAFATQRFHADPRFSVEKADSLYEKWILTSFDDPLQQIATLDIDNEPAAFMIYFKKHLPYEGSNKFAMWKFTVINPEMRGKGIGKLFFNALKAHHANEGLDYIESGVSLRNLPSLNLHNKNDFRLISTLVTLHKWLF